MVPLSSSCQQGPRARERISSRVRHRREDPERSGYSSQSKPGDDSYYFDLSQISLSFQGQSSSCEDHELQKGAPETAFQEIGQRNGRERFKVKNYQVGYNHLLPRS